MLPFEALNNLAEIFILSMDSKSEPLVISELNKNFILFVRFIAAPLPVAYILLVQFNCDSVVPYLLVEEPSQDKYLTKSFSLMFLKPATTELPLPKK